MIDYNVEVKKEFNKHHNLAKVQEKFPQLNPASIVHYALDTAVYQYTSKPDKDESKIKTLDLTNIKPNTTPTNIITNIDDKDIKFISGGREINITGRKTINYQELFYMVMIEGRSLEYLLNVLNCNEYSILKGLQFLHAEAKDEVIKAKIIEYSNIYFFKA
nr:MAG TPA: hypothetical protein [Caudoviricetes sp.]